MQSVIGLGIYATFGIYKENQVTLWALPSGNSLLLFPDSEKLLKPGKKLRCYLTWPEFCYQIFFKKCLSPMTIWKYYLEFKSTYPMGITFDGIRFGWIFSLLKDLFHNVNMIHNICQMWVNSTKKILTYMKNFFIYISVNCDRIWDYLWN